jgi:DNA-binding transcriptional ArsR family regulator
VVNLGMSETLKAISDPVRRDILEMLKKGKKSAGEIAESFSLTNATVSYHLSQLKKADLITEFKYKNYIYYELNVSVFEDLLVWIYGFGGKEDEKHK